MWGLPMTEKHASVWSARAIFKPGRPKPVELLPDRQSLEPPVESPMLLRWLNNVGLPWLQKEAGKLSPDSRDAITMTKDLYTIAASPCASYGYLYVSAWRKDAPEARYELPEPPADAKWSGGAVPKRGDQVTINFNGLGQGVVTDYFVEHGYLGLRVKLDQQPKWHADQNDRWPYALVFGKEVA